MKLFLYRIICGFFLGISVVAPGFSGAIVAIAMGIYHELLRIISNPLKDLRKNIMFCFPLGIGVVASLVLFILVFVQLFETHTVAVFILFVGLIAGNIPIIYKEVKSIGFKAYYLIGAIIAFALAVSLGRFATGTGLVSGTLTAISNWPGVAIGGVATGVTALIPGMSLATVLLLIGLYEPLLSAGRELMRLDFAYILPLGVFLVSVVVGLMLTAKGIKYLFKKYPGFANTTVLGFMLGSLVALVMRVMELQADALGGFNWLIGALMFAIGIGVSILFVSLGKFMNKSEDEGLIPNP